MRDLQQRDRPTNRAVSTQFVRIPLFPSRANRNGQVVNTFQFQGNVRNTLPPRRCWSQARSATYASRDCDFLSCTTNARVVGLQDSSSLARHFVRSDTVASLSCRKWRVLHPRRLTFVYGSFGFGTCPPSEHVAPRCVEDPREKCPHTGNLSDVHQPQETRAQPDPDTTLLPPSAHTDISPSPSLQFCPPCLNYLLQFRKFLECGSCPLSTLCVVTAIQTREAALEPGNN